MDTLSRGGLLRVLTCGMGTLAGVRAPASAQAAPALTTVNVGLFPAPDMATFLYAQREESFRKAGLDVHAQTMQNGGAAVSAMVGGSLDIAYANSFTLIQAHQHGLPVKLVFPGGVYDSAAPTIRLVVGGDSPIKTASDLTGKTIGVSLVHDITGLSVTAWLAQGGVDPSTVHFLELPPPLMLPSLQSHRIDAALSFDPFLSSLLSGGARAIGAPFDAIGRHFLAAAWFTLEPWATQHPAAVRGFVSVMARTATYVNAHYEEMVPVLADYSKIPPEVLRAMPHVPVPPAVTAASVQPVIDTAAKFHEIPTTFKAEELLWAGLA